MSDSLTRRQVLRSASLAALASMFGSSLGAGEWLRTISSSRVLVVLEFEGGNDGLNTVVPYDDANYLTARSVAGIRLTPGNTTVQRAVIPFSTFSGSTTLPKPSGFGVNAGLTRLQDAWQAGDMAIIHGVGYGNPNLSHFRGIDIWNNGATDDQPAIGTGWLGRMMVNEGVSGSASTNAMLFARANQNPVRSPGLKIISLAKPKDFLDRTVGMTDPTDLQIANATSGSGANPALAHLLNTQRDAKRARSEIAAHVGTPPTFTTVFPNNDLGTQALYIAQCIAGGLECPFYKMSIGGFDNHTNQVGKHYDLLTQVGAAIAALRSALSESAYNRWDDVLVMTNSEFGRRVNENASFGTDHGTAAPHFVFGGKVKGGIYGTQPSLAHADLDPRGDLVYQTDFRQLAATAGLWLGASAPNVAQALDPFHMPPTTLFTPVDCVTLV